MTSSVREFNGQANASPVSRAWEIQSKRCPRFPVCPGGLSVIGRRSQKTVLANKKMKPEGRTFSHMEAGVFSVAWDCEFRDPWRRGNHLMSSEVLLCNSAGIEPHLSWLMLHIHLKYWYFQGDQGAVWLSKVLTPSGTCAGFAYPDLSKPVG